MKYTKIDGMTVSRILLGTANIPAHNVNTWLNDMLALGVNFIDTARVYQGSEAALGKWFDACGTRDKVVLLSKCCHPFLGHSRVNAKAIRADLKRSLAALNTDHIDIYLLHRDDLSTPVDAIVETLNELKAEDRIHSFGGSNWTHQRIEAANEYAYKRGLTPFTVSSPNFSLAAPVADPWGWNSISIAGDHAAQAWYRQTQMPVVAYSSLAHGLFSGRMKSADAANADQYLDKFARRGYGSSDNYERLHRCEELAESKGATISQIALSWIFHRSMNMFAVVSTGSADRMRQNIAALDIELDDAKCRYLNLEI